jgi:serralysin
MPDWQRRRREFGACETITPPVISNRDLKIPSLFSRKPESPTVTGSSRSDIILGGSGDDFLNGGFGFDHLTGGSGADRFYHEGVADHGSDWITDYYAAEGDVLCMGKPSASAADFIVQFAETVGAGQSGVKEAFVTYIPTRQILWAIEDGELADQILIQLSGATFDLI